MQIVNKVREVRKQQGLTQQDLAKAVGVTRQTIIELEKGEYNPSLLLALQLSRTLDSDIEGLFSLDD